MIDIKRIEDYPDYSITTEGNVISHKFGKYKTLKPSMDNLGYTTVTLCGKIKRTYRVHTLVATAFLGNLDGNTVNHEDGDKLNNRLGNLEVMSLSANIKHAFNNNLHPNSGVKVEQINSEGKIVNTFESMLEAERVTGISNSHINAVARGKRRTAGGYVWRYFNV